MRSRKCIPAPHTENHTPKTENHTPKTAHHTMVHTAALVDNEPLLSPALLAQLERMELISRKIFRGRMKGERRSKRKGQSVEFADFRNYVAGDDLRFIDWNPVSYTHLTLPTTPYV